MGNDRARMLADIADTADALTEPYDHTEQLEHWDANRNRKTRTRHTRFPALLDQLAAAAHPGAANQQGAAVPASRPPVDLDAVSAHASIAIATIRWCIQLYIDPRNTAASNIRALVGAAAGADSTTQADLLAALRGWRAVAAIITGWRDAPYRPPAPCPHCDARGTLRVRLDAGTAACLACHTTWDRDTIGLLGRHVETYRDQSTATAAAARTAAVQARRRADGEAA